MRTCQHCQSRRLEILFERVGSDAIETNATLRYTKCADCGRVDNRYTVVEFCQLGDGGGSGYNFDVPAHEEAWLFSDRDNLWNRVFPVWLTTKEIESRYNLKPGTARQAVHRGYVTAKKEGNTLFIEASEAERYWWKSK